MFTKTLIIFSCGHTDCTDNPALITDAPLILCPACRDALAKSFEHLLDGFSDLGS